MRVVWTRRCLQELSDIGDYIGEHNPRAAARVIAALHARTIRLLGRNPFLGRAGQIAGTRELVLSGLPYVIAYRVVDDRVEVLFVQHAAREWPREF